MEFTLAIGFMLTILFPPIFRDLSTSFNSSAKQMHSTLGHCFKAQPQLKDASPLCSCTWGQNEKKAFVIKASSSRDSSLLINRVPNPHRNSHTVGCIHY